MISIVIYFILWLALVYVAVIYNSMSLIFLAGVGMILPLFLLVILIYQCISLKLSFGENRQYLQPEEIANVTLQTVNPRLFPIKQLAVKMKMKNITTGETRKQWVKRALSGRASAFSIPVQEFSYGVWNFSCTQIRLKDFLQWFSVRKFKRVQGVVVQMPRCYEVNIKRNQLEQEVFLDREDYESNVRGTDASHIREIREYRPGDKPKDIHWKLSAKRDELMVKEYVQPLGYELVLGLDRNGLDDASMEVIYSLLTACMEKRTRLLLLWREPQKYRVMQCELVREEDAYYAMERIMTYNVCEWRQDEMFEFGKQLWLKDRKLYLDGIEIQDFSQGNLDEKLLDMELIL